MKTKITRRAFLMSLLSLLVCVSMLVGTTFAWFTDSVTSANNIIQSGNLDVEMYWADGTKEVPGVDSEDWKDASEGAIFNYDLWEPGYTEVRHIKIANEGTLALKYQLKIQANGSVSELSDVIDVYYVDPAVQVASRDQLSEDAKIGNLTHVLKNLDQTANGALEAGNEVNVTLALKMQESAGNEYQNLSIGTDFSVVLVATQMTSESDSFGSDYDSEATYPVTSMEAPMPEDGTSATDIVLSTIDETTGVGTMLEIPKAVVEKIGSDEATKDVEALKISHTEPVFGDKTITFDSIDLVDQMGNVIDLEAMNNETEITVTIPVGDTFAVGEVVTVYHDDEVVAAVIVSEEKEVTYTVTHFCRVELNNGDWTDAPNVVPDEDALGGAIADGKTEILLGAGEYKLPSLAGKENLMIIGSPDGGTKFESVNSFDFGKNTTIKNITFKTSGSNSVRYATTSGDVVFENCVFEGAQYAMHIDNANNGTVTFNNCTFTGRNAFAASGEYVFNNCTFKYKYSNYNTLNIYSKATFTKCRWDSKLELAIGDGAKAILDGEEVTKKVVFISDARALEAFAREVNSYGNTYAGVIVMLSDDIDMKEAYYENWTPVGQTGATQFQGTFDGHGFKIKNLNIDTSTQKGPNYSTGLFGWLNHATIKNLTIENATVTGNHNVGVIAGYMETAGCTISNCHVINATVVARHANDDACGDKVGVIVGHAGNAGVLVEKCSAKDSTVTAGRDAGQLVGAAKIENVKECTAGNVVVSASGECTGANVNNEIIGRVL